MGQNEIGQFNPLLVSSVRSHEIGYFESDIKILKIIINNNFIKFIFCKIKFI